MVQNAFYRSKIVNEGIQSGLRVLWTPLHRLMTLKSGLKTQIFDVKFVFLKNLKKTAFSVILRTPGFPRFPSPGVMQVHPMPRKLLSGLRGLAPPRRILELVL